MKIILKNRYSVAISNCCFLLPFPFLPISVTDLFFPYAISKPTGEGRRRKRQQKTITKLKKKRKKRKQFPKSKQRQQSLQRVRIRLHRSPCCSLFINIYLNIYLDHRLADIVSFCLFYKYIISSKRR